MSEEKEIPIKNKHRCNQQKRVKDTTNTIMINDDLVNAQRESGIEKL